MAKILIIDDEPDVNAALCTLLKAAGHTVVGCTDQEEVEARVARERPDLIFLDVMVPGNPVAGFDTCRALKAHPDLKAIPIVVISAMNEKYGLGYTGRGAGDDALPAEAFLEKPVEAEDALELVRTLLAEA